MVEKELVVKVVLNCCFSGGVVRKDSSVRYLGYDPDVNRAYSSNVDQSTNFAKENGSSIFRTSSLRPNWLVNPDGYTVLTACGPDEIAKELTVNRSGDKHGALSYFLLRAFTKLGGVGGNQRQIYHHLRARFLDLRAQGLVKQTPMFYGNVKLCFFGPVGTQKRMNSIPIIVKPDKSIQLEAGEAHGIGILDEFYLTAFHQKAGTTIIDRYPLTAQVATISALTSELKLISITSSCPETGWIAEPNIGNALSKVGIKMQLDDLCTRKWEAALKRIQSPDVLSKSKPAHDYNVCMSMNSKEEYEIRDEASSQATIVSTTAPFQEENMQHVLDVLKHICQYSTVRGLHNSSVSYMSKFIGSFNVHIVDTQGKVFQPGCTQEYQTYQHCSHNECMINVEEGDKLQLHVENCSEQDGNSLYLHLYNMGCNWDIENMLHANHEVIPPKDTAQRFTRKWKKNIKMVLSEETRMSKLCYVEDIIKVFLTARPTSFASLELPELVTPLEIRVLPATRNTS